MLDLHDRGLPVRPPQPRFLPQRMSGAQDWTGRAIALGLLLTFALVVLKLFAA